MDKYGETLTVEIVAGGFILSFPIIENGVNTGTAREVFSSPRKLQNKIKELIGSLGLVTPDSAD